MKIEKGQVYRSKSSFQCNCGHYYLPSFNILEEVGDSFRVLQVDEDTTPDGSGHGPGSIEKIIKKEELEKAIEEQFELQEKE